MLNILLVEIKFRNSPCDFIDFKHKGVIINKEIKITMKAVLFARVSTREQAEEGYSLPAQEKLLKEYSSNKNYLIVKNFSVPESASGIQERKLFNELLDYLSNHPEIKFVICEKVDRITRNFKDAVKLDDWLNENEERQIHFVKQSLIIHKHAKSNEKFMWDIYLAMARQYSNNLSEEIIKGLNEKANQGWYPGRQKRGYKTLGDAGHRIWIINTEIQDSKYIEKAFALYNTGNYTLRTLSKELFDQGWIINGKPISKSELHKLLIDCFYCGEFVWNNKRYPEGNHSPLISKELFYSVQDRLQRKIKGGKYHKHTFLLGGALVLCSECGRSLSWQERKGHHYGTIKHDDNCHLKEIKTSYLKEETAQKQIVDILDGFKIDNTRLLEWVRKALKESHKDESNYHTSIMKGLEERKRILEKRLDTIYDDRVDGTISKELYNRKQKQYEEELENMLESINKHTKANIDYFKLGINLFELSQKGSELYLSKAVAEEKRELLNFVFLNFKFNGAKLNPTPHNGFEVIASCVKTHNWLPRKDSNLN